MKKIIHISLDAMGGDNAPEIVVEGAFQSKVRHPNLVFSFFGDKSKLLPLVDNRETLKDSNIILKRYNTYMDMTRPVLDFYSKNSNFYEIDGALKIEQITAKIDAFLNV